MSLTPEELIALGKACKLAGFAPSASRPMGLFAAGIAHERARAAKVCRNEAQNWSIKDAQRACRMCAAAIEAPADGGQLGE